MLLNENKEKPGYLRKIGRANEIKRSLEMIARYGLGNEKKIINTEKQREKEVQIMSKGERNDETRIQHMCGERKKH